MFTDFKVYIPHSLDLLNQSDKFSSTLESSKKLLLSDLFNAKKKKNFAHEKQAKYAKIY